MKYIIKNCPANLGDCCAKLVVCEYNTDCTMKKIVEKCYDYELYSSQDLAEEILELLEIEECKE